jgi:hypothetical protein
MSKKKASTVPTAQIVPHETVVQGGTARVEPQFRTDRFGQLLCRADSYEKLHQALYQAEELEESQIAVKLRIDCYPLDGIVAVNKALERVYGFTHAKGEWRFFDWIPPQRLSIEVAYGQFDTFAYGKLNPPAWESGWIQMVVDQQNPLSLMIVGQIKRKFEPQIQAVVKLAQQIVKTESIYHGSAVELDLDYIDKIEDGEAFNPEHCAPRFIDISEDVTLILPRDVEFELETDVWNAIRHPEHLRVNEVPIKLGVLLSGDPGGGKTLTAAKIARVAAEEEWTYFYLKTPRRFPQAYRLGTIYPPAVLFIEDIDTLFGGKRTGEMNTILETMDGISTKEAEIITIFTTNFPDKINEAFMRSGRVDNHIHLGPLDAESAARFIKTFSGHMLDPDVDYEVVGDAFAGLMASDIRGGVNRAKKNAVGKFGSDIDGKITTEMLVDAGTTKRRQRGVLKGDGLSEEARDLMTVKRAHRIVASDGASTAQAK